jgi:hypothetical protein
MRAQLKQRPIARSLGVTHQNYLLLSKGRPQVADDLDRIVSYLIDGYRHVAVGYLRFAMEAR